MGFSFSGCAMGALRVATVSVSSHLDLAQKLVNAIKNHLDNLIPSVPQSHIYLMMNSSPQYVVQGYDGRLRVVVPNSMISVSERYLRGRAPVLNQLAGKSLNEYQSMGMEIFQSMNRVAPPLAQMVGGMQGQYEFADQVGRFLAAVEYPSGGLTLFQPPQPMQLPPQIVGPTGPTQEYVPPSTGTGYLDTRPPTGGGLLPGGGGFVQPGMPGSEPPPSPGVPPQPGGIPPVPPGDVPGGYPPGGYPTGYDDHTSGYDPQSFFTPPMQYPPGEAPGDGGLQVAGQTIPWPAVAAAGLALIILLKK